jgi:hypothetical protein
MLVLAFAFQRLAAYAKAGFGDYVGAELGCGRGTQRPPPTGGVLPLGPYAPF